MVIKDELLKTLCCPVARSPLRVMKSDELQKLNEEVARGQARYAGGTRVAEPLESGLATIDGASVYAVRTGVPILLPELRIARGGGATPVTSADAGASREGPAAEYWEELSRHWHDRNPPRRPAPPDIALLERLVGEGLAAAGSARPHALLLGVTPEIAMMRWPAGMELLAVDSSMPMIRRVWPARKVPEASVVRGDWATMPIRDAAIDVAVGDASISMQQYPDAFFTVVGEVRRVLKADGLLATRAFTRPEEREPLDRIFADLRDGRIGNLDFFRWRLIAALHGDRATGTRLGDIWEAWDANVADPRELMESLGWPPESSRAMEHLRGAEAVGIFPTLGELREDLSREFEEVACEFPDYEDGERYPTLLLRPRPISESRPPW